MICFIVKGLGSGDHLVLLLIWFCPWQLVRGGCLFKKYCSPILVIKVRQDYLFTDASAGIGAGGLKLKSDLGVDLVKETVKFGGGKEFACSAGLNANTGDNCKN